MALETATYINQLVSTNPLGSDPIASGDDHIRLLKSTVKATFPNVTGPVTVTQDELNAVTGALPKAGGTMTGALVLSGAPTVDLNPATKKYADDALALKADKAVTLTAGTGLSGGGDLSANRSLALANTAVTPGSYGSASKLARVTVDAQGRITAAQEFDLPATKGLGLGGEAWNDVTGSRSFGTTYTNSRSYPIMVSASTGTSGPSPYCAAYVGSVRVSFFYWQFNGSGAVGGTGPFIVPPGATYRIDANAGLSSWSELY